MNIQNYLNKPFTHKNWFTNLDDKTGFPETTNKEALMYFASCSDFILNKRETAILYTGKEKGRAIGKIRVVYFKFLRKLINEGLELAKENIKHNLKNNFGFTFYNAHNINIIVIVKYYHDKPSISIYFEDYLKKFANKTYKDYKELYSL
ncbi:hypothetical protein [Tenacibaculum ovolyticum]|uniref:hypothetical protein n=1 Tax=Tenacibaculum ovolyticum TaxID=104270 RepID=UPI0007EC4F99|nr:hypothetical protein [Tenacibaculum ovolyticum]